MTPAAGPSSRKAERDEIVVIREFMPKQMSADETREAVKDAIAATGAASMKDMGKVMAALKERYAGQMDFAKASAVVKELLSPPKTPETNYPQVFRPGSALASFG